MRKTTQVRAHAEIAASFENFIVAALIKRASRR